MTTCRKEGDGWVLNGQKKWIGNSTFADVNVIWARDEASGQVKGFVVGKDNPGFSVEKIKAKMALRVVQNGLITLKDCWAPESDRLQNANTFKDCAKVLRMTRTGVAWFAVGCAMGAYEHALRYALERKQFGKPIGGIPACPGCARADARQPHRLSGDDAEARPTARARNHGRRTRFARQGGPPSSAAKRSALPASSSAAMGSCLRTISAVSLRTPRLSILMKARAR